MKQEYIVGDVVEYYDKNQDYQGTREHKMCWVIFAKRKDSAMIV